MQDRATGHDNLSDLLGTAFSGTGRARLKTGDVLRFSPPEDFATGCLELTVPRDNIAMQIRNFVTKKDWRNTAYGDGRIHMHFHLRGKNVGTSDGMADIPFTDSRFAVFLEPRGLTKHMEWESGDVDQSVIIDCEPEFLIDELGVELGTLPDPIRRFVAGKRDKFYWMDIPLPTSMMLIAQDILHPKVSPPLTNAYRNAKALEILCLGTQAICLAGWHKKRVGNLAYRDFLRVGEARQILEAKFRRPPTILELARSLNMDASTLCKQFKAVHDCTIFEFVQRYRMEHASELLHSTDMEIKAVAYELGYNHTSNFTAAFKRYFGTTPRAARETGRNLDRSALG